MVNRFEGVPRRSLQEQLVAVEELAHQIDSAIDLAVRRDGGKGPLVLFSMRETLVYVPNDRLRDVPQALAVGERTIGRDRLRALSGERGEGLVALAASPTAS
jgi:hypothetical protein